MGSGVAVATGKEKPMGHNGKVVTELVEFIDAAERMGNYPTNTAGGIKAAIRKVSSILTDEEAVSLDTFRNHLESIFQRVFNKSKSSKSPVSAISLKVYRTRINTVLSDYEQYGRNHEAMASWKRRVRTATSRRPSNMKTDAANGEQALALGDLMQPGGRAMTRVEIPLSQNAKAILLVPSDLSEGESKKIKAYIDAGLAVD